MEGVMKKGSVVSFLVITALLAGCASSKSGEVYSRDQARQAMTVRLGVVEFVKEVKVEGEKSGLGTAAGGIAGGVAGSTIGGGKGSTLAALGGAALGAIVGTVAEEKMTKFNGLEITVKLDDGSVLAVVQENDVLFAVGDRVRVLTSRDGTTRVEK
jgi:outer membrane lipoprotein SlyB